jgi:hypothetical protein
VFFEQFLIIQNLYFCLLSFLATFFGKSFDGSHFGHTPVSAVGLTHGIFKSGLFVPDFFVLAKLRPNRLWRVQIEIGNRRMGEIVSRNCIS